MMLTLTEIKIIIVLAFITCLIGGSVYVTHSIDKANYEKAEISALADAVKKQQEADAINYQAAQEYAQSKDKIIQQIQRKLNEVQKFANAHCITVGIVRLHDEAASGREMPTPSGKSDDSCSGATNIQLYNKMITNYGIARQNATQLNKLEETILKLQK